MKTFSRTVTLIGLLCLCACGRNDFKQIAGGYRLKQVDGGHHVAFCIPHSDGGAIIDEIGWAEPIILFRTSGSEYWDLIDTSRARHTSINDRERKSDSVFRSIQMEPADVAWNRLNPSKRLW